MTTITRFGAGGTAYNFAVNGLYVISYSDNFGDVVPRTTRLPGMDGGYDEFGSLRAPVEIGKVTVGLVLASQTRAAMDALRRDVRAMVGWGVQRLFRAVKYQTEEQWCYARINNINVALNEDRYTDLFQPVQLNFQVADPAWYAQGTETWVWGDGTKWGEKEWGGSGTPAVASGTQTDLPITVAGNFPTQPRILITPGVGNSCQNPIVQRLNGVTVVDEISYTGTLNDSDTLAVDCRKLAATVNGTNAYADFDYQRGRWMELQPGSNTLRVIFENASDTAGVRLRYFTRWV